MTKVREQLAEVFEESQQSVYLYLDDINKVCNKKFAALLGYESPRNWANVKENFPEAFVSPKDRKILVSTYQKAMNDLVGSTISVAWRKKGGGEVPTTTILVPIVYEGHRMALHFITPL
jgi:carbohydrate-binding DOMON domain-containing protein